MAIRLRITLLFVLLVTIILATVCMGIYFVSFQSREKVMKSRLTNRAITTGKLLSQRETFNLSEIYRIDASTAISIKNKKVEVFDSFDHKIYDYSDIPGNASVVDKAILKKARSQGRFYFNHGNREAVAYYYKDEKNRGLVIISSGEDTDGKQNLQTLLKILVISFLVAIFFIFILGYAFSKKLLNPVKQITKEITDISAQNLKRRIQTGKTEDEWHDLATTLNKLLDRLYESFEMQKRFISNASHELCTPLTSILSQLEVILNRKRDPNFHQKLIESVYMDVQNMSKLTRALLQLTKTSESTGGLEVNAVRVDDILLKLPEEISKIDSGYSVCLSFDNLPEEESKLWIACNEILLLTAIKNIVLNACKYSDNKTAIVSLHSHDTYLLISIEDKGIGIDKENLNKIFQPFYRVEENQNTEGFGIGLTLALRIIKLHKGLIDVSSEPGKGTKFTIQLPVANILEENQALVN